MVKEKPEQDPCQIMESLDVWRRSLAAKMHVAESTGIDVYYLNMQTMSYRSECVLCRLIRSRSQQSGQSAASEWAKQRLRNAILELDTIAIRVMANELLYRFPMYL
jgi:hypothetical protein